MLICPVVEAVREAEGIAGFARQCLELGRSRAMTLSLYVNGKGPNGSKVKKVEHLRRGKALGALQTKWL